MTIRSCDYEILHPDDTSPEPPPEYPDRETHAAIAARCRANRPRRFAVGEVMQGAQGVVVSEDYQGFRNPDGTVVLLAAGRPYGHYQSLASAYARVSSKRDKYLVWLEPDPRPALPGLFTAQAEAANGSARTFMLMLPFAAGGLADARLHAITVSSYLSESLPGFARELTQLCDADNPTSPLPVWCPETGCTETPYHDGPHTTPDRELDDNAGGNVSTVPRSPNGDTAAASSNEVAP